MPTKQELMDMFGLKDAPDSKIVRKGTSYQIKALPTSKEDLSETVLKLDRWDRQRGLEALQTVPSLRNRGLTEAAMADFHAAAFLGSPTIQGQCKDQVRQKYMEELMETPDYRSLHTSTMYSVTKSTVAAEKFAEQFAQLLDENHAIQKCNAPQAQKDAMKDLSMAMAVAGAGAKAEEEVQEAEEIEKAMGGFDEGIGHGKGSGYLLDHGHLSKVYKKVRNDPTLRRICELAGKFRRMAQSKQRQKFTHGYDDMVGVELNGEVGKLLPQELAMLNDPIFGDDVMRRIVERQALCRDHKSIECTGKGPIVLCIDESGSMQSPDMPDHDQRIHYAKAFALSMVWVAHYQKRWCCLSSFSDAHNGRYLVLPPHHNKQEELLHWLGYMYGGGTEPDYPLEILPFKEWPKFGAPKGKTDYIIITDGQIDRNKEMEDNFNKWKLREKVNLTTLVVKASRSEGVERVSNEVHYLNDLSLSETAILNCLSI